MVCKICASPNNLILAAAQSRLEVLLQKERKSAAIMVIIVMTYLVCWAPSGIAYSVSADKHVEGF